METRKKILITGAAGNIGSYLTQHFFGRYNLVLSDIHQPVNLHGYPFLKADITDLDAMRSACQNIDTVLHLAADSSIKASWKSLQTRNIIGVYNVFQAAHEARCRRVIFASSAFVVLGYPEEIHVHTNMPVRPPNLYGASKAWGEAVARLYADQKGLSCICLRLGFVKNHDHPDIHPDDPMLDKVLTYRDLTKLVVTSIEAPDNLRFGIFHGLSDNRYKRLDIKDAITKLGYKPEDDAFVLAGVKTSSRRLFYWKRVVNSIRKYFRHVRSL
ncbi:MAG: NAD-dependent epimerase/dehydratase family protein [Planctomycetota bacterium]